MKKIFKALSLVLALVLVCAAFTGCSGAKTLKDIQNAGKITVATSPDFPPFESLENGEIVGIEVEIMELIAAELGVEIVFEEMDFDSVLPGVQAGKFDCGMSGISITEERQKNADFTDPYFLAAQAIVVLADSDISSKDDLDGLKISVQTGTTAEEFCMANGYEVLAYQANNDACSALTSGKVDAWVVDNEVALAFAADYEGELIVLDDKMTTEPYGFAFMKGSDDLVEAFNEIIAELIENGTIEAIFDKYGVTYVAP